MADPPVQVDDQDSSVVYSHSNSVSDWVFYKNTADGDKTMSLTNHRGATASLTFTGTSIGVYGIIPGSGDGYTPSTSSYSIDGGTAQVYSPVMTTDAQYHVQFFVSPQLSSGQHALVVTNLVDKSYLNLDFFLITTQNSPKPISSASTSLDTSGQASMAVPTTSSEVVVGSSSVPAQMAARLGTSQSQVSTTSGLGAPSSGTGSSSGDSSGSFTAASKTPFGPIIGGVLGGIALLRLIIASILFFRRRHRKGPRDEVHLWPSGPLGIAPFPPPPPVSPPNMLQSSGTPYPSGKFDQRLFASGRAAAAFPAQLPPAQVTGERQSDI